jgi:hypothetical protein
MSNFNVTLKLEDAQRLIRQLRFRKNLAETKAIGEAIKQNLKHSDVAAFEKTLDEQLNFFIPTETAIHLALSYRKYYDDDQKIQRLRADLEREIDPADVEKYREKIWITEKALKEADEFAKYLGLGEKKTAGY